MSGQDEGFVEAGGKPKADAESLLETINLDDLRLVENKKYIEIAAACKAIHTDLLQHETNAKAGAYIENPALLGDYLGKLRLNCNQLFTYINIYIDILSDLQREYAAKRQGLYETQLKQGKSPSAAEKHAREMSRIDETTISVIENNIQQIKNEYERYNGICMYLQSRMKEFNTERMVG